MKKFLIILLFFNFQFSIFNSNAQDRNTTKPVLPFMQQAPKAGDDEQLAIQFFQDREFEKAAEIYARLYQKSPTQFYYSYLLYCYVENRDWDKAEKLVKNARKSDPDAPKFLVDQGYIKFRQGDEEKAGKLYDEAVKKLQPNQQQIFDLANAFISKNENEYAIKTYQKGRQLLNNAYPFGFEMAAVYERIGDFKNELAEYYNLLDFNKSYLPTVQDRLQSILANDPDNAKNEIFRKSLLEKAQKEPDKTCFSELLWWYSVQQKDFGLALLQAKSLDRRLKEDGGRVMQLAQLCVSNQEYDVAIEGYKYVMSKGPSCPNYDESKSEYLNTRYYKAVSIPDPGEKLLSELEKEFNTEIAAAGENHSSIKLMKNLAHLQAFYLGRTDDAINMLDRAIGLNDISQQVQAECKLELADILLFTNNVWDATLTYQQVYKDFKNDAIGQEAKFRNAKLSFYIGEFKWANAQLDVLRAATSKLIANDAMALSLLISENLDPDSNTVALGLYAKADLQEYRNQDEKALQTLDSIPILFKDHPIFEHVLYKQAVIRMKQGRYTDADTLLGTIVAKYPEQILADLALYTRGKIYEERLGMKDKAMQYYEELLKDYPGSIYVVEARKRYRTLRGDKGF